MPASGVTLGADPDQLLGPAPDAWTRLELAFHQRKVQLARVQQRFNLGRKSANRVDADVRIFVSEFHQQSGQAFGLEILREPEPHDRVRRFSFADRLLEFARECENALRIIQQHFSVLGQRNLAGGRRPLHQLRAESDFELPDLLAHRRLGSMHSLGGPREGAGFHHGHETL